ncbi:MAG: dihydroneopterin aldolase [Peptococcaceae bacterium]|jgi:dihydroneopterin aldolase|nr:dihydroneopterin aldolase [Peptococcaceae bacterium]
MREHDKICLSGMEFYAYHGVSAEEKRQGQRFSLDVELYTDLSASGQSDDVADTINYADVYHLVSRCVSQTRCNLLERLAELLAQEILAQFPCAAVRIVIHKPQAPIPGIWRDVSIEILRAQAEGAGDSR